MSREKDTVKQILKQYRAPVKGREFLKYWKGFIVSIVDRDNFNESHLKNLEILCRAYVEYDRMTACLEELYQKNFSYSYVAEGRYGTQIKMHPEFNERQKLLAEIRQYSRLLGVVLNKDNMMKENDPSGEWE